jgi:hypothetical protein
VFIAELYHLGDFRAASRKHYAARLYSLEAGGIGGVEHQVCIGVEYVLLPYDIFKFCCEPVYPHLPSLIIIVGVTANACFKIIIAP